MLPSLVQDFPDEAHVYARILQSFSLLSPGFLLSSNLGKDGRMMPQQGGVARLVQEIQMVVDIVRQCLVHLCTYLFSLFATRLEVPLS